jgi:hypothetical protein
MYCYLDTQSGQVPRRDEVTHFTYIEGSLDKIITEDGYNSSFEENGGYFIDPNTGRGTWIVNFDNINAVAGDLFTIQLSYRSRTGYRESKHYQGTVPAGTAGCPSGSILLEHPDPNPAPPRHVVVYNAGSAGVVVDWVAEAGLVYHIYRSNLPSGNPVNTKANGVFQRRGRGVQPPYTDVGVQDNTTYWYLVLAEDSTGNLSAHDEEILIVADASAPTPTVSPAPATSTPTPTPTATSGHSPTPGDTPTPGSPTLTPTPTATLPHETPTPGDTPTPLPTPLAPLLYDLPPLTAGTSNTLAWSDQSASGGVEYLVQKGMAPNFPSPEDSGWIGETTYEFTGLVHGEIYYYRVKTRTAPGIESCWSNIVFSEQDAEAPLVGLAGYFETRLRAGSAGTLVLAAVCTDPDVATVGVYFERTALGLELNPSGTAFYLLSLPLGVVASPIRLPLEIVAFDAVGQPSPPWPYLVVE